MASVAGELGFEPRLTESESAVLPLNYSPAGRRVSPLAAQPRDAAAPRGQRASYLTAADRLRKPTAAQTCGCRSPLLTVFVPAAFTDGPDLLDWPQVPSE